jgi:hypothetical protein
MASLSRPHARPSLALLLVVFLLLPLAAGVEHACAQALTLTCSHPHHVTVTARSAVLRQLRQAVSVHALAGLPEFLTGLQFGQMW